LQIQKDKITNKRKCCALITFMVFLKDNYIKIFNSKNIKIFVSVFLAFNIYYCTVNTRIKYDSKDKIVRYSVITSKKQVDLWDWIHWNYNRTFEAYETVSPYLRSIGIQRADRVISIPDPSFNISLCLMDQKGFTDFGYYDFEGDRRIKKFISMGAKYLIINDTIILKDRRYLKPYLKNKIGEYKNILIYDLY